MALHDIAVWLYNLDTSEGVDITSIALEKKASVRHNHTRNFTVEVPSGDPLVTDTFGDGYPAMRKGNRKLLVFRDDEIIHHGRVFGVERTGDGTTNRAVITSFDPLMELGYDSEDRAGRPVRDETGNFISPSFTPSGGGSAGDPISGADLIFQILTNSQVVGDEGDPGGEGPLPIDLTTGDLDLDVPPAIDLGPSDSMSWPVMIGDFIQQIVDSNVVDIYLRPVDPIEYEDTNFPLDPYQMVALSAVNLFGTDRSSTVHFDYWTGSKNAKACRHVEDFSPINNKLYDYLGPRVNQNRWKGNIVPGSPGTIVDPSASRALYGVFMQIREFDSVGTESSVRPLFIALWNAEQGLRVEPRDMLFITPNPDSKALFEPYTDYNVGDLVTVNVGGEFGVNIAAVQRIYGWDVEWDRNGIERVSQLLVSADVA